MAKAKKQNALWDRSLDFAAKSLATKKSVGEMEGKYAEFWWCVTGYLAGYRAGRRDAPRTPRRKSK